MQGEINALSTQLYARAPLSQLGHIQFTSNFPLSVSIYINVKIDCDTLAQNKEGCIQLLINTRYISQKKMSSRHQRERDFKALSSADKAVIPVQLLSGAIIDLFHFVFCFIFRNIRCFPSFLLVILLIHSPFLSTFLFHHAVFSIFLFRILLFFSCSQLLADFYLHFIQNNCAAWWV